MDKKELLSYIPFVNIIWGITELRKSAKDLEIVEKDLTEIINRAPKSISCVHSRVPEGRQFCDYFKKSCIAHCNSCLDYLNKFNLN